MKKILFWTLTILSFVLLIPAFIIAIPGFILYVLSEECEKWDVEEEMKKEYKNE